MKMRQVWLGEEHLGPNYGVMEAYIKIMKQKPDQVRFREPRNFGWCRREQLFDDDFCDSFVTLIQNCRGAPICYVLCIGSKDIRSNLTKKEKEKLLKRFHRVVREVHMTPQAALIVISPLPDSLGLTDHVGDQVDSDLALMCQVKEANSNFVSKGRIHYLRFRRDRIPLQSRRSLEFFDDACHLNKKGAEILAQDIFDLQAQISGIVFTTEREDFYHATTVLLKAHRARRDEMLD